MRWTPLAVTSRQIDCQLFGLWAGGHHLSSVVIHGFTAVMLLIALHVLTGMLWRSAFVAAVFAVHPQHVEAVCWLSARSEILGGLCFALTLWAYAHYVQSGCRTVRYLPVAVFLGLGLLSKQTLVTTPVVLVLLDYWPLKRLQNPRDVPRLLLEKIPLFLLALVGGIAALLAQEVNNPPSQFTLSLRVENAFVACKSYLRDFFIPMDLTTFYPIPETAWAWHDILSSLILILVLSAGALLLRKSNPYLTTGWFWFLSMLLPVSGIIYLGGVHSHADRYTYMSSVGLALATTWWVCDWLSGWRWARITLMLMAFTILGAFSALAKVQSMYWRDTEALMRRALYYTPNDPVSNYCLGCALVDRGSLDAAEIYLRKVAVGDALGRGKAFAVLANLLGTQGRLVEALEMARESVRINPDDAAALQTLGKLLYGEGKRTEGASLLLRAVSLDYSNGALANDLAWMLSTAPEDSIRDGKKALEMALQADKAADGNDPIILDTLAAAYAETGDYPKALESARKALILAEQQGNKELSDRLKTEITLYEAGKPCRDPR
jgi:Tfp pilus assembly protein PilF